MMSAVQNVCLRNLYNTAVWCSDNVFCFFGRTCAMPISFSYARHVKSIYFEANINMYVMCVHYINGRVEYVPTRAEHWKKMPCRDVSK